MNRPKSIVAALAASLLALWCSSPARSEVRGAPSVEVYEAPSVLEWRRARLDRATGEYMVVVGLPSDSNRVLAVIKGNINQGPSAKKTFWNLAIGGDLQNVVAGIFDDAGSHPVTPPPGYGFPGVPPRSITYPGSPPPIADQAPPRSRAVGTQGPPPPIGDQGPPPAAHATRPTLPPPLADGGNPGPPPDDAEYQYAQTPAQKSFQQCVKNQVAICCPPAPGQSLSVCDNYCGVIASIECSDTNGDGIDECIVGCMLTPCKDQNCNWFGFSCECPDLTISMAPLPFGFHGDPIQTPPRC